MGALILDRAAFNTLHPFLQTTLVRYMIARLAPTLRDVSYDATMRAIVWITASDGADSLALPGNLSLERYGEDACLRLSGYAIKQFDYPQIAMGTEQRLDLPGEVVLENGWRISSQFAPNSLDHRKDWFQSLDATLAVFQVDRIKREFHVRGRAPGDRIKLPGLEGTTKISDLMINRKIPKQVRDRWPLVVLNGEIIWVPGIHRSDCWMLQDDESEVLLMQLLPPDKVDHNETAL